jgi:hypothetical protein
MEKNLPNLIIFKIRDEIQFNPLLPNLDNFNFSSKNDYQNDVNLFYELTNHKQVDSLRVEAGIQRLRAIAQEFDIQIHFLYNQIYENGLQGQINELVRTIIQSSNVIINKDNLTLRDELSKNWIDNGVLNITNFYNYFYIEISDQAKAKIVIKQLQKICISTDNTFDDYVLDYVHFRYSTQKAGGVSSTSPCNDFFSFMGFKELRLKTVIGNQRGEGITIIDCETAWKTGRGLPLPPRFRFLCPNNIGSPDIIKHGTQVASILTSTDSSVNALCPNIDAFIGSPVKVNPSGVELIENAILLGLIELNSTGKNGIILLEQELPVSSGAVPVESIPSIFFVIQLAYYLGISVIEPAGNSTINLDSFVNSRIWSSPRQTTRLNQIVSNLGTSIDQSHNITILNLIGRLKISNTNPVPLAINPYGKSMAIIVGGYGLTGVGRYLSIKNFGNVITCYAQAECVPSFCYTDGASHDGGGTISGCSFGDTSAASAIMAGFVAILQSVQINRTSPTSRALKPDEIREAIVRGKISGSIGIPNIMRSVNYVLSKTYVP